MSKKVLILTADAGDSYEALYAYQRLLEADWEPFIAAPSRRRLHLLIHDTEPGWDTYIERLGHCIDADVAITAVAAKDFAALLIIGGRAPEYLRNDPSVLSLAREFAEQNKCIGAIGHGIQILTAAELIRGKTVTGHPHVRVEVEAGGGHYAAKPAVRDGNLVTAQSWRYHPEFYREFFDCLNGRAAAPPVRGGLHLFSRD
jgi:protease I